jgi:hypothetical protein
MTMAEETRNGLARWNWKILKDSRAQRVLHHRVCHAMVRVVRGQWRDGNRRH